MDILLSCKGCLTVPVTFLKFPLRGDFFLERSLRFLHFFRTAKCDINNLPHFVNKEHRFNSDWDGAHLTPSHRTDQMGFLLTFSCPNDRFFMSRYEWLGKFPTHLSMYGCFTWQMDIHNQILIIESDFDTIPLF